MSCDILCPVCSFMVVLFLYLTSQRFPPMCFFFFLISLASGLSIPMIISRNYLFISLIFPIFYNYNYEFFYFSLLHWFLQEANSLSSVQQVHWGPARFPSWQCTWTFKMENGTIIETSLVSCLSEFTAL